MSVHMILGPMYSGKTSLLMRRIHRAEHGNQKCLVIKHKNDNRFGPADQLVNRSHHIVQNSENVRVLCLEGDALKDLHVDELKIFIDEGQFFSHLKEFCLAQAKRGAEVVVAALDFDSDQNPFPCVNALMPWAKYEKATAICQKCREAEAPVTQRLDRKASVLAIGDSEYTALCIKCAF